MTRHNQPARAAAARTFLASLGARGSTHLDTQFSRQPDPARYAKSSPRVVWNLGCNSTSVEMCRDAAKIAHTREYAAYRDTLSEA